LNSVPSGVLASLKAVENGNLVELDISKAFSAAIVPIEEIPISNEFGVFEVVF
jgi:hypothetical protein